MFQFHTGLGCISSWVRSSIGWGTADHKGVSSVRAFLYLSPGRNSFLVGSTGKGLGGMEGQPKEPKAAWNELSMSSPDLQAVLGCREQALHWAVF